MKVLKLTRARRNDRTKNYWARGSVNVLCASGLSRAIDLPTTANTLYVVFTKTGPADHKFTIKSSGWSMWGYDYVEWGVKESRAGLLTSAGRILAREYNAGHRYVHFEYS